MDETYFFGSGSVGEDDGVMHLIVVINLHEVGGIGDGVASEIRRHTLKEILVGRNARTHNCGIVDVEKDMQNGHHSARIILNLVHHGVDKKIPVGQR